MPRFFAAPLGLWHQGWPLCLGKCRLGSHGSTTEGGTRKIENLLKFTMLMITWGQSSLLRSPFFKKIREFFLYCSYYVIFWLSSNVMQGGLSFLKNDFLK